VCLWRPFAGTGTHCSTVDLRARPSSPPSPRACVIASGDGTFIIRGGAEGGVSFWGHQWRGVGTNLGGRGGWSPLPSPSRTIRLDSASSNRNSPRFTNDRRRPKPPNSCVKLPWNSVRPPQALPTMARFGWVVRARALADPRQRPLTGLRILRRA